MRTFYLGIAIVIAMASCTHEELVNSTNESKLQVSVESSKALSRVGFDKAENWSFFWHKGDEIWVNEGIMSTSDADKSKTATFTGYGIDTNTGYAVYPYAMAEDNVNGSQLTWNFPSTYTYDDVDADFFTSAQGIPMYAKVKDGKASFKHLGAIVAFKFNDWEFTGEHVFTLTSSKKISGEFTSDLSGETPVFATTTEGEDVVTVTYNRPANASGTSIVFYVPIPTGTYDLKVKVTVDGATKFAKTSNNKIVNRGDIVWAEIGESVLVGDNKDVKEVASIDQIDEQVLSTTKEDLTVQVTEEVTGSQTIEIPASLKTKTTTFMFENVADNAVITINNETGGAYDGQVIIEVPVGETIPTVNANVPNGEVYIKQGTVTTLVVSSKKNTTIIGTGVKVEKLSVNQGNVRVEKDSEISAIENNTNGTLYITNAGGTLPSTLPDNTIVVYEDTEHAVVLNDKYSTDNITELMSYGKDVLNTNELSFTLSAGQYEEVVKVTGGKNITFEPKTVSQEVSIAGLDHQSNGTPSTVIVKNITLDNTLQTEGWFTGTAQNIKPCVGAWGGNFTFEGCKFIVSGESKAETGVMTWWIVNKMSLTFNDCTFEGKDNHESARAMQIYGNADLTVTNCTFNTYKDYSLKYVATEGNVATFDGNKVYNTKNFVQLGSALYAGSKYTVKINNTTLGDGVSHYYIDNDENQKVYIDGAFVASTAGQLSACLTGNEQNITVVLANDIELPIASLGTITAGSGEYKLGGENTETITIDLNNNKLNITTTYWSAIGANNNDATITIKNGTMTSTGNSAGTWNAWDVRFSNCNYVIEDVTFEKAVALDNAGKSAILKGVTIKDNHNSDTYALWITAEGQTVTLEDNCVIDMLECTDGRGIKIDEQYVDSPQKVTLKVSNTTFSTEEKSAILVKSAAGAEITLDNINIEKVEADKVNAVWCDEDAASYNDLIIVTGGSKKVEGQ